MFISKAAGPIPAAERRGHGIHPPLLPSSRVGREGSFPGAFLFLSLNLPPCFARQAMIFHAAGADIIQPLLHKPSAKKPRSFPFLFTGSRDSHCLVTLKGGRHQLLICSLNLLRTCLSPFLTFPILSKWHVTDAS